MHYEKLDQILSLISPIANATIYSSLGLCVISVSIYFVHQGSGLKALCIITVLDAKLFHQLTAKHCMRISFYSRLCATPLRSTVAILTYLICQKHAFTKSTYRSVPQTNILSEKSARGCTHWNNISRS